MTEGAARRRRMHPTSNLLIQLGERDRLQTGIDTLADDVAEFRSENVADNRLHEPLQKVCHLVTTMQFEVHERQLLFGAAVGDDGSREFRLAVVHDKRDRTSDF